MKKIIGIILAAVMLCLLTGVYAEGKEETAEARGSDLTQAVTDALAAAEENGETDRETIIASLAESIPADAEKIRTLVDIYAAIIAGESAADPETVLPAYSYTGEDPIEGAIANVLAGTQYMEMYLTEPGCVCIPCPVILKTEMTDETHTKVYGIFWTLNYIQADNVLLNISGGEHAGIALLEKEGEAWHITELEETGEGEEYAEDIRRFANGDQQLLKAYQTGNDLSEEPQLSIRKRFIREYAEANNLKISAFMDLYWDPIPLE